MLITGLSLAIVGLILLERKLTFNRSDRLIPQRLDRRTSRSELGASLDNARLAAEMAEIAYRPKPSSCNHVVSKPVSVEEKSYSPIHKWEDELHDPQRVFVVGIRQAGELEVLVRQSDGQVLSLTDRTQVRAYLDLLLANLTHQSQVIPIQSELEPDYSENEDSDDHNYFYEKVVYESD